MHRSRPASIARFLPSPAKLARELMASLPPIVMELKCLPSAAVMWAVLTALLLWAPAVAAAADAGHGDDMKSIYAGPKVVPVRLGRPAFGPESLAFDHRGGGPYTGVSNGRVLRWRADRRRPGWTEFAHNYKHATVAECAAKKKVVEPESVCGRPLGLQFHRRTGDMYVADAYLGLMRVGRRGGLAEVVATEAGGVPFNFVNGVDVDQETGDVYFTDSSTTYQRSDYLLVVLSGDATGRLLRYEARTGNVTVLKSGLAFPNGVAVSRDGTHLVVAETASCRLLRHWLRGSNAGATEVLAELPGYPDNVRPAGGGDGYWVALNRDKEWAVSGTTPASVAAIRVVVDGAGAGKVAVALRGFGGATVSEVVERNGSLWFGSVDTPYVGLLKFTSL
ncbi:protein STRICTOSIDINE SYNTHASE-LIKE 10-like [Oryza brachyantha]|uniref:protein STRICTOSIDINE SYNTHASE-LIKE 10-like n=1 Tax=Oryza brachyantha TaxID=4533 RepID=UPI001ADBBD02|nr:protein STRICTOSIDINE SYNTHASE-LIKE 10-like [Oryza brachyantha]